MLLPKAHWGEMCLLIFCNTPKTPTAKDNEPVKILDLLSMDLIKMLMVVLLLKIQVHFFQTTNKYIVIWSIVCF